MRVALSAGDVGRDKGMGVPGGDVQEMQGRESGEGQERPSLGVPYDLQARLVSFSCFGGTV